MAEMEMSSQRLLHGFLQSRLFPETESPPLTVPEPRCQVFLYRMQNSFRKHLRDAIGNEAFLQLLQVRFTTDELHDFQKNEYAAEMVSSKTLKRFYDSFKTSATTLDILQAYKLILDKEEEKQRRDEKEFRRIAGKFYNYAVHNSSPGKYRISIHEITGKGDARNHFKNSSGAVITKKFETRLIGTTGLLLTHEKDGYLLIFFLYIGKDDQPDFIQGVSLYSNSNGNTIANLSLFQRIPDGYREREELREQLPARELSELYSLEVLEKPVELAPQITVKQNIQRFLYHMIKPISALIRDRKPLDFSKSAAILPDCNGGAAPYYDFHRDIIGHYKLYFNERFPSVRGDDAEEKPNGFYSTIGIGLLDIKIDEVSGIFVCKMEMQKDAVTDKPLIYTGKLINNRNKSPSTIILAMYLEPTQHRYLHILFNIVDGNKLMGCFNISYHPPGELGAGIAIAIRQPHGSSNAENRASRAVFASKHEAESKIESKIVSFLSHNHLSRLSISGHRTLEAYQKMRYWGVYRMYFNSRENGEKRIKQNVLIIRGNGKVTLYNSHNDRLSGKAEESNSSMLSLTIKDVETGRQGFMCIHVDDISPRKKQKAKYAGSYVGFSRTGEQRPVASQFIIEYAFPEDFEAGKVSTGNWKAFIDALRKEKVDPDHVDRKIVDFMEKNETRLDYEQSFF